MKAIARILALTAVAGVMSGPVLAACADSGMPPQMFQAYAKDIQSQLAEHGYDPGPPDGKPGSRTRAAIRTYQRDAGLATDGCISKELAEHLHFVQPKVYAKGRGAAGNERTVAREVQEELTRQGFYLGPVDGKVGPATRRAVRSYQASAGLPDTGAVDQQLLNSLKNKRTR